MADFPSAVVASCLWALKYNKRLLSELLVHDKFQQLMVDAEVYVDRIADSRINDMNAMLEAVRQQIIQQYTVEDGDLHTRTLALPDGFGVS